MDELNDVYSDLLKTPLTEQPQIEGVEDINVSTTNPTPSSEPLDDKVNVSEPGETTEAKPTAPDSEGVNWDDFIDEVTPSATPEAKPQVDWAEIGKAINIGEIKSQEDVTNYISSLKQSIEELKAKPVGNDLPKDLAEAIEIAKNGGDYRTFLDVTDIDYSKEDPIELFEDEVAELFFDNNGHFREEEYKEYIDSIPDVDKKMRGRQLQRELTMVQEQNKAAVRQKAMVERQESLKRLSNALDKFDKVDNFNVTPKVKQQLFNDLSTGQALNDMGISSNGNHNWEKLLNNYFKAKYFDAVQKFNSRAAVNQERRSTMDDLTNSTVIKNQKPENAVQSAKKSGFDLYMEQLK